MRERHIRARDGLRLFFKDWGSADWPTTPALCLAGLTRNSHDFDVLARRLSAPDQPRPRRVIALDLRGRGRSAYDPDWRNYNASVYLDDIRHLLAALGIRKVVLIGISMGGLLGMALATALPTALAGLVMNDIGPEIEGNGRSRIFGYIGVDRPEPDWTHAVRHLREMFPTLSLRTDEEWLSFARGTYREGDDGQLHFDWDVNLARPLQRGFDDKIDLWALWRALRPLPTLAIRGGLSDILSEATLARMKAEKPDLGHFTIANVGHTPTLNEPPLREVLDDFLNRL